jgi:SAM-dependent methyltransferase
MANIGQALFLNIGGMMGYSQNQLDWVFGLPKSMKLRSFESVLDFGCGSLPRNPLSGKKIYGVDLSSSAPFEVTDRLEYKQITPGANLPFENDSLDAITGFDVKTRGNFVGSDSLLSKSCCFHGPNSCEHNHPRNSQVLF